MAYFKTIKNYIDCLSDDTKLGLYKVVANDYMKETIFSGNISPILETWNSIESDTPANEQTMFAIIYWVFFHTNDDISFLVTSDQCSLIYKDNQQIMLWSNREEELQEGIFSLISVINRAKEYKEFKELFKLACFFSMPYGENIMEFNQGIEFLNKKIENIECEMNKLAPDSFYRRDVLAIVEKIREPIAAIQSNLMEDPMEVLFASPF